MHICETRAHMHLNTLQYHSVLLWQQHTHFTCVERECEQGRTGMSYFAYMHISIFTKYECECILMAFDQRLHNTSTQPERNNTQRKYSHLSISQGEKKFLNSRPEVRLSDGAAAPELVGVQHPAVQQHGCLPV